MEPLSLAVAGSTQRTALVAEALRAHTGFTIPWVLTPVPKLIGRQQTVTPNPLHTWATQHGIAPLLINDSITTETKSQIEAQTRPDILLVVDFGYIIPSWLLTLPHVAPLNIHPSALPEWRGSSPGQFVLLTGAKNSAVSIIVMNEALDQGPIVQQLPFTVEPTWDAQAYYANSFLLVAQQLPHIIEQFVARPTAIKPQPVATPTPLARRLDKIDAFVDWSLVSAAMHNQTFTTLPTPLTIPAAIASQPVLGTLLATYPPPSHPTLIERASRAFSPWPSLWTQIPTANGPKRMLILSCAISTGDRLELETVRIEGLSDKPWREVKNYLSA